MLAEIYIGLQGGREQKLFAEEKPRASAESSQRQSIEVIPRRARPGPLAPLSTEDERAAHTEFVAQLGKDPLWSKLH
jgi:DNA polymerase-3 subunit epsilon